MTMAAQEGADFAPREFDALALGRLTWLGLTLAAIGWALLLGEATLADIVSRGRALAPTFHADLVDIAKCLIGSGFGLAIVGGLQSGFGALNRFFSAVLMRSSQRQAATPVQAEPYTPMPGSPMANSSMADSSRAMPSREARPYRTLPDGSVEVDTILGTRRFDSMAQARDFI